MSALARALRRFRRSEADQIGAEATAQHDVVFNIVWTGTVFEHLRYFVASQLDHCGARFRFISNGCDRQQVAALEAFAAQRPDRVIDVTVASVEDMVGHGVALDAVLDAGVDERYFGLIDPDIRASGPFVEDFLAMLDADTVGVTSGRGVWSDTDHIPAGHPGVNGEYFWSTDGFLFGSPHFAIYERSAVVGTRERWGVGFGSGGPDLSNEAKSRLAEAGHDYIVYDTGKLMNAFLQFDGHTIRHHEHPNLMHIGGLSHFLSPPAYVDDEHGERQPDWVQYAGMEVRFRVAQYTAAVLMAGAEGSVPPEIPHGLDAEVEAKLRTVRSALIDMVERYGDELGRG